MGVISFYKQYVVCWATRSQTSLRRSYNKFNTSGPLSESLWFSVIFWKLSYWTRNIKTPRERSLVHGMFHHGVDIQRTGGRVKFSTSLVWRTLLNAMKHHRYKQNSSKFLWVDFEDTKASANSHNSYVHTEAVRLYLTVSAVSVSENEHTAIFGKMGLWVWLGNHHILWRDEDYRSWLRYKGIRLEKSATHPSWQHRFTVQCFEWDRKTFRVSF